MRQGIRRSVRTAIGRLLQTWADRQPTAPLLWVEGETEQGPWYSYADGWRLANGWARQLEALGVGAGERVGIVANPHYFVFAWLAVMEADAVAVPLNPFAPVEDQARALAQAGARWLIAPRDPSGLTEGPWTTLEGSRLPVVCRRLAAAAPRPQPAAGGGLIVFTSGTTGDPKPIGLPIASLLGTARQVMQAHRLSPSDIGFSPLPLFHINAPVVAVLATLVAGGAVVVGERFHRRRLWPVADRHRVTWVNAVPAMLNLLAAHPEDPGPGEPARIRFIRSASAPLPVATLTALRERWGIPIVETYGLSEAGSQVTANPLPPPPDKAGSVGRPTGVELRVVDAEGHPLPPGAVGEVEIRGATVIDPAWGPNQWAAAKMRGGWYRTGDLGYLDADGYLFLRGRVRDLINRGGEKVFPREVEEVLLTHPAVAECAVVGRPHPLLGEEPVAFVVAKSGVDPDALREALRQLAERGLSPFKRPAQYLLVDALPQNATGKIQREHLRRQVVAVGVR